MNALQRLWDRLRHPEDLNRDMTARRRYMAAMGRHSPPQPTLGGAQRVTRARAEELRKAHELYQATTPHRVVGVRLHEVLDTSAQEEARRQRLAHEGRAIEAAYQEDMR